MKVLFIGGTGIISTECVKLAVDKGMDVVLLNRGNRAIPEGASQIIVDINDEEATKKALEGQEFDCVAQFVTFHPDQMRKDVRLFKGICKQYIFISSASAYEKPASSAFISEKTPLVNPYWKYSREKIQCEDVLKESGMPYTIVRPSHTYCEKSLPVALHGPMGHSGVIARMLAGKPVIIPGDGSSLWTVTHSRDFAKAFVGLIGNEKAIGEDFGITSDFSYSWDNLHKIIAKALGVEPNFYHVATDFMVAVSPKEWDMLGSMTGDKSNSVVFDNSKVKALVPEFVCETTPEIGLTESVQYLLAQPEQIKPDPVFDEWCDRVIASLERAKEEF